RPIFSKCGRDNPFLCVAIWPSVSAPTSLKSAASGASPIPTESNTIKNIRLKFAMLFPPSFPITLFQYKLILVSPHLHLKLCMLHPRAPLLHQWTPYYYEWSQVCHLFPLYRQFFYVTLFPQPNR